MQEMKCSFSRVAKAMIMALGLTLTSSPVLGHSKSEETIPKDGAVLESAPDVIGVRFDRGIRITFIQLTDASGADYALERLSEAVELTNFQARPGALAPGAYKVEWRGVSEDGHPMKGGFSFVITE